MIDNIITLDFETEAIVGNPVLRPPRPVGCAVWIPGQEPFYLAWGHPTENNCTWMEGYEYLRKIWRTNSPLLFHNAPFDLSVYNLYFGGLDWLTTVRDWRRFHDTMYLLALSDPYAATYSLKPSADRYLGMAASEQSAVHDWILKNVAEATPKTAGAFICRAPGDLVGDYAVGDVVRTKKLYDLLHGTVVQKGMEKAYDRERELMPTMVDATRRGIRIDRDTLSHHEAVYTKALSIADNTIRTAISSDCEIGGADFANALDHVGMITDWVLTPTGKRSMAKGNLKIANPAVKALYEYRQALETCLSTFIRPWLEKSQTDGRVHPNWNQVRQSRGDRDSKGTRTNRLSSDDPNFQNVPSEFTNSDGSPLAVPEGLVRLPIMREYCLPDEHHVWLKRDYSGQELRILAHFEDGPLCEAYTTDPSLDPHRMAQALINEMVGIEYARKTIKITSFSLLYGSGVTGLSAQLGVPYNEAYAIKNAYLGAMPGIQQLMDGVKKTGERGEYITTLGGRMYYSEPPALVQGQYRRFDYKLLNYLIQGSAADQTKMAINDWAKGWRSSEARLVATVHDEINISAPQEMWEEHMARLKREMNAPRLDVPVTSEGYMGTNWQNIEKVD